MAGRETTATSLSWAFERVLCHPEVEARLRGELASAGGPGALDPALVEKLPYLDAVLKKASRQRPVLPLVARALAAPAPSRATTCRRA